MATVRTLDWQTKLDIMELIWRYNHAIDSGDADGVADCFVENGVFRAGAASSLDVRIYGSWA